ncbi:zinc ribbon domain-containing protein [Streptomyces sp. 184]|uniref:zinc ribbon domain-containing protein n=1 Tax=Streptomyces sp. 184 TaxID=1827526 RepID=UPI0038911C35
MRATATAPGRTYLLAGVLHCGVCGRRMDSCWSHDRPAYRCRHGRTTATGPSTGRPRNTYVREDRILARLPALLLRLTEGDEPTSPEAAAARLRAENVTLTYDPADQTLTAGTPTRERIHIA